MPETHLFEYAIIRVVPRVEREEFLNVGAILYCRDLHFLEIKYKVNHDRLSIFCQGELSMDELEQRLMAFEQVCKGKPAGGPIGVLPIASRFRWLTATRSTVVQTSPVHVGMCANPAEALERLYEQLVK